MRRQISHFASIIKVTNPKEAAEWYRDHLGFEIRFEWGSPPDYVVTGRDEGVSIHFSQSNESVSPQALYLFCYNVDEVYEDLRTKGIAQITTPADQEYGMRDFDVIDPWGNQISFGTGLK